MATVPSQGTVSIGNKGTAALWNDDVRDAINFLLAPPRAEVYQGASTNMPTSGTAALMLFDTEAYDSDTMHSTSSNTSRLVATTAGLYAVFFQLAWAANATGVRQLDIKKNAGGNFASGSFVSTQRIVPPSGVIATAAGELDVQMNAGDYLEMFGTQTSGGALASSPGSYVTYFGMRWVATS